VLILSFGTMFLFLIFFPVVYAQEDYFTQVKNIGANSAEI